MRTWFITGATRGFGALIAKEALQRGDAVVATGRKADAVLAALGSHANLLAVALDVTREADAHAAVEQAVARFGRIDILVNNAGFGLLSAVEEASAGEVERLYATNVFGLLAVTRAVLPTMRRQRAGHVINMSSVGGFSSGAGFSVYCSTKFAVEGISEGLAEEVAPLGLHVTSVQPGYFRTDFLDSTSLVKSERVLDDYSATVGALRAGVDHINHNQPGDPAKLAKAIMALVDMRDPPRQLALGSDTVRTRQEQAARVMRELEQHRALSLSTDFGPGQ
jgi:NAD(P)-dependent dehydrogenase (short-subunit alcohol dehydrogenase family)